MAGDLIRFVDSISASPTTRLDLNDEVSFWVKSFSAPPPRLRRSMASNAMRDGISVGSSSYDGRTLTIELECRKSTQDAAATEIQKLWRELDRANNWIQYQPNSLTKPVFFRTFRSDASQLEDVMAQAAMRTFTIEVLAEPFALGLKETLGPYAISNDPAAGSNPSYVDISGVLGDVPVDPIIWNTTYNRAATLMGIRHGDFNTFNLILQAESMTLGTDTTNPGGGPDAVMSGTGTNNFRRTSFATATMANRISGAVYNSVGGQYGEFVIYAAVRRSDATSVITAGVSPVSSSGPLETVTIPQSTSRQLVRLGRHSTVGGQNYGARTLANGEFNVWAQRVSGAGTLDWDCFWLIPADSAVLETLALSTSGSATADDVFDGVSDRTYSIVNGSDPTTLAAEAGLLKAAGRIPQLVPNVTSRLFYLTSATYNTSGLRTHAKSETNSLTIYYWPRYLHVRPVSS